MGIPVCESSSWAGLPRACLHGRQRRYLFRTECPSAFTAGDHRSATSVKRVQMAELAQMLGSHANDGTMSQGDVLRCGISNQPMSARGQNENPSRSGLCQLSPVTDVPSHELM